MKVFAKPWAMTTVMFLGMSICLPLAYLEEARARKGKLTAAEEPLIGGADVSHPLVSSLSALCHQRSLQAGCSLNHLSNRVLIQLRHGSAPTWKHAWANAYFLVHEHTD